MTSAAARIHHRAQSKRHICDCAARGGDRDRCELRDLLCAGGCIDRQQFGRSLNCRKVKKVDRAFCSLKTWFWREFAGEISAETRPNSVARRSNPGVVGVPDAVGADR